VPGTWVLPPQVGFLWTPGYWAFSAGFYGWHPGYWGPTVGFYGGINYGFGYTGVGYWGGYWHGRDFYYNRAVNNVNIINIHNVYNRTVINNVNVTRVSYNGGPGGIQARPTSQEMAAERGRHFGATSQQVQHEQHEQFARNDRAQFASVNHGRPAVGATSQPAAFNAREASRTNQSAMNRPATNANAASNTRAVPHPPQNNQQARASWNVPRPPQINYSQPRASQNVTRSSNYQQARGYGNVLRPGNYTQQSAPQARNVPRQATMQRPAAPQYHAASRPPSQRPAMQRAAAQRPSGGNHKQERSH